MPNPVWEVIGGRESGGVVVRQGVDLKSKEEAVRLSYGAYVEELTQTAGGRLRYRRLTGTGPDTGWVSIAFKDRPLLTKGRLSIAQFLVKPDPTRDLSKSYAIEGQELASGSFGSVFRAAHRMTGEERAIKRILRKQQAKPREISAVETELKLLVTLDHPNIAKFFEYFVEDQAFYLVTEFCSEGTFTQLEPDADDGDSMEDARLLFRDVVSAMAYCHERGVVHRDLKCDNCLIVQKARRRHAKVIDFGVSAIKEHGDVSGEWLHEVTGTPFYRAPEVLDECVPYGTKADLWSVGVMLYVAYTGEHPFFNSCGNESLKALRAGVKSEPLEHARLPDGLKDLIMKLIVFDQSERLDAVGALQHEWLGPILPKWRLDAEMSRRPSEEARHARRKVSNLRGACNFRALAHFERALLTILAHYAREQDVVDLRLQFRDLDSGKNGSISKAELKAGLSSNGLDLSADDIDEIFATIDTNGDGQVEYTEWLAATLKPSVLASESALKDVFCFLDHSGTGTISRDDLRILLGDSLARRVLRAGNKKGDDCLNFEEFRSVMQKIKQGLEPRLPPTPARARKSTAKFFNGDGLLTE